jgi:hypothetical protein
VVRVFVTWGEQPHRVLDEMRAQLHLQELAEILRRLLDLLDRAVNCLDEQRVHLREKHVGHTRGELFYLFYHLQHHTRIPLLLIKLIDNRITNHLAVVREGVLVPHHSRKPSIFAFG